MPNLLKPLIRIHLRQIRLGIDKRKVFAYLYLYAIWWLMLGTGSFFGLDTASRGFLGRFAPALIALICMGCWLPDLIYKLFTQHSATVMDAFLKTRPIPQSVWNRFLWLSQCWTLDNLLLPLLVMPIGFLFLPFWWGVALLLSVYGISVFNAIVVLEMKRGGNYAEISQSTTTSRVKDRPIWGGYLFGIQLKSFLRSKRLRTAAIIMPLCFLPRVFTIGDVQQNPMGGFMLLMCLCLPAITTGSWGFGIEANFFQGLWSKPITVYRLLNDKYRMLCLLTLCVSVIFVPICLLAGVSVGLILPYMLYAMGFCNVLTIGDAYNRSAMDLFGKAFFNYQGTNRSFSLYGVLTAVIQVLLPLLLELVSTIAGYDLLWAHLIEGTLGIIGLCLHRPFFRWVERRFMKKKYTYMEKYNQ